MTSTPTLGLTLNDTVSGSTTRFLDWRLSINGSSTNTNMVLIDSFAANVTGSLIALANQNPIIYISASSVGGGTFGASASIVSAYNTNMIIDLKLDTTNPGTTVLNINGMGTKTLQKLSSGGSAVNLDAGDLVKNRNYLFRYNGSTWEWVGATSSDQITMSGNPNEIVILSTGSGLASSGTSLSSLAPSSASYVTLALNPSLTNEYLLSAGSGTYLTIDSSASTVSINSTYKVFNIKDPTYGATGNGSTDDTVAIQNAINAAGKSIIFAPSGSYVVSETFFNTGQNVEGEGLDATIFYVSGSSPGLHVIGSYCSFKNFSIYPVTGNEFNFTGMLLDNVSSTEIDNVRVKRADIGFQLKGACYFNKSNKLMSWYGGSRGIDLVYDDTNTYLPNSNYFYGFNMHGNGDNLSRAINGNGITNYFDGGNISNWYYGIYEGALLATADNQSSNWYKGIYIESVTETIHVHSGYPVFEGRSLGYKINVGAGTGLLSPTGGYQPQLETHPTKLPFKYLKTLLTFSEGTGNIVFDKSGNSKNGTISGGTWQEGLSAYAVRLSEVGSATIDLPTSIFDPVLPWDCAIANKVNTFDPAGNNYIFKITDSGSATNMYFTVPATSSNSYYIFTESPSSNLVLNPGFETPGSGHPFANWTETAGTGTITDETSLVHSGSHALKMVAGSTPAASPIIVSNIMTVVPGTKYTFTFWTRGDGTYGGRYRVTDITHGTSIVATTDTGVTGTSYTQVRVNFIAPVLCTQVQVKFLCPNLDTRTAYFDDVVVQKYVDLTGSYQWTSDFNWLFFHYDPLTGYITLLDPTGKGYVAQNLTNVIGTINSIQFGSGSSDATSCIMDIACVAFWQKGTTDWTGLTISEAREFANGAKYLPSSALMSVSTSDTLQIQVFS